MMTRLIKSHIKILHVIGAFAAGGAERFVVDLLRSLKKQNISVGVYALSCTKDKAGEQMCDTLKKEGIPFGNGPTETIRFRSFFSYVKQLYHAKPNIIHLHTPNTELAHFLGTKFYKKQHAAIRTLHNTNIPNNKWYWHALRNNQTKISIACSSAVQEAFAQEISQEIITIQNGIMFDWPVQTTSIQRQFQTKLDISNSLYHFLNVGRLGGNSLESAAKGHNILIQAWKEADLGNLGCQLHLIGDGNLRTQLEQLAAGDPSILFHGVKNNVHDWLLAADCFVMPSRHEGLPIAAIEAIGSGLPCVFSDIAPLRELKSPVAIWSQVNDFQKLADNLSKIKEIKKSVPKAKVKNLRHRFGMGKVADRYLNCYIKHCNFSN